MSQSTTLLGLILPKNYYAVAMTAREKGEKGKGIAVITSIVARSALGTRNHFNHFSQNF